MCRCIPAGVQKAGNMIFLQNAAETVFIGFHCVCYDCHIPKTAAVLPRQPEDFAGREADFILNGRAGGDMDTFGNGAFFEKGIEIIPLQFPQSGSFRAMVFFQNDGRRTVRAQLLCQLHQLLLCPP